MKRSPLLVAALAFTALALAGCATPNGNGLGGGTPASAPGGVTAGITVRGVGKVTGTPDTATVELGVQTRGVNAQPALDANSQQTGAVIAQLKAKGVADADLRTSGLSVSPTYGGVNNRITGYEVTNQITVTIRDIAAAGGIIDAAAQAAGDAVRVQQLSFGISDDSALRTSARTDAVHQAQAQAKQLAEAAGVGLGPIRTITEVASGTPPQPYRVDASAEASAVPVQPGTQELQVAVEIVYDITQ